LFEAISYGSDQSIAILRPVDVRHLFRVAIVNAARASGFVALVHAIGLDNPQLAGKISRFDLALEPLGGRTVADMTPGFAAILPGAQEYRDSSLAHRWLLPQGRLSEYHSRL